MQKQHIQTSRQETTNTSHIPCDAHYRKKYPIRQDAQNTKMVHGIKIYAQSSPLLLTPWREVLRVYAMLNQELTEDTYSRW